MWLERRRFKPLSGSLRTEVIGQRGEEKGSYVEETSTGLTITAHASYTEIADSLIASGADVNFAEAAGRFERPTPAPKAVLGVPRKCSIFNVHCFNEMRAAY